MCTNAISLGPSPEGGGGDPVPTRPPAGDACVRGDMWGASPHPRLGRLLRGVTWRTTVGSCDRARPYPREGPRHVKGLSRP